VVEGPVRQMPRGRRPRLLSLNIERAGIIGVNVMPSSTTLVLADLNADFRAQETLPTPRLPEQFIRLLCDRVSELMRKYPDMTYEGLGISVPGRVDYLTQELVFAPNLGWHDVDLRTPLERATGLLVQIENAANACALAEVWSGANEGQSDLIAITVSEGIGTGIIANGKLVRGPSGAGGEFGHVTFNEDGPLCSCGSRGCWEVYASNAAAIRYYSGGNSKRRTPPPSSLTSFSDLVSLAERGEVAALSAIQRMAHYLGLGIAMLVTGLAPAVIAVVGEVTRLWASVEPIIQRVVAEHAPTRAQARIVPSDYRSEPRLRGTIALVLQKHFEPKLWY
jgi:predicted NBD/HSP70 family sugar kinase